MTLRLCALSILVSAGPLAAADAPEALGRQYSRVVKDYVQSKAAESEDGSFHAVDAATRKSLRLSPGGVRVHADRITQFSDGTVFACSDLSRAGGKGEADLDFYVKNGRMIRVLVHKVDGIARFTYDDSNRMIPAAGMPAPAKESQQRAQFKSVALPGSGSAASGHAPPAASPAGGTPPVQMPVLPPGITLPAAPSGQGQGQQEHPH